MKMHEFLTALAASLLFLGGAVAQENKAEDVPSKPAAADPVDPEVIKLYLMDGSVLTGKLSVKEIEVETPFGKLTIPVTEVRAFRPGLASHPELGKKVFELIDKLGSTDFDERETSQKELIKMGASIRKQLEKHLQDSDTERRMRVKNILAELDNEKEDQEDETPANPLDKALLIQHDTVETTDFTVVGKIVNKTFTVTSLYGPLTVKLADIRSGQHEAGKKPDERKTISVDSTNLVQRSFKDSGIRVERGEKVTVTAEGTLTMTPWGHNAVSTPEGAANYGWYMPNTIPTGCLIAAVGTNDTPFKIGSKNTFKATRSGTVRFAIAMQHDYANQNFPGKYTVKIKVERN